jgi:hypothetical protein
MAAGFRGLLAPWLGGAGANTSQAGTRGLLAPWIGGASAVTGAHGGVRSLLAPWIGGASAVTGAHGGVRSLLAFWIGGGASAEESQQPELHIPADAVAAFLRASKRPREEEAVLLGKLYLLPRSYT